VTYKETTPPASTKAAAKITRSAAAGPLFRPFAFPSSSSSFHTPKVELRCLAETRFAEPARTCSANRSLLLQSVINHLNASTQSRSEDHAQHLHLRSASTAPQSRSPALQHHRHCQPGSIYRAADNSCPRRRSPNHKIRSRGRHLERQFHRRSMASTFTAPDPIPAARKHPATTSAQTLRTRAHDSSIHCPGYVLSILSR